MAQMLYLVRAASRTEEVPRPNPKEVPLYEHVVVLQHVLHVFRITDYDTRGK